VIGPEGGLSADERDLLASHQARRVSLGTGVLRVETAALALAARLCR
jgi:16S rRNA (uracil1498-N3)-methyltransferase